METPYNLKEKFHTLSPDSLQKLAQSYGIHNISHVTLLHTVKNLKFYLRLIEPTNPALEKILPPNELAHYKKNNMLYLMVATNTSEQRMKKIFNAGHRYADETQLYEIIRDEESYFLPHTFYQVRELTSDFIQEYPDAVLYYLISEHVFSNKQDAQKYADAKNHDINIIPELSKGINLEYPECKFSKEIVLQSKKNDLTIDIDKAIELLEERMKEQPLYMVEIVSFINRYTPPELPFLNSVSAFPADKFLELTTEEHDGIQTHLFSSLLSLEKAFFHNIVALQLESVSKEDKNKFIKQLIEEGLVFRIEVYSDSTAATMSDKSIH